MDDDSDEVELEGFSEVDVEWFSTACSCVPPRVVGIEDVKAGYRPEYPVTVYAVTNDDTSGIIGLLYPNGDFHPVNDETPEQRYWDHTETDHYENVGGRIVGNSWRKGYTVWNGKAGHIYVKQNMIADVNHFRVSSEEPVSIETKREAVVVNRRLNDTNSLTGSWDSTSEIWHAFKRGTGMFSGRKPGRIHYKEEDEAA